MFRLKKHKETGARRALMRNSATGRIVIVRFYYFVSTAVAYPRIPLELQVVRVTNHNTDEDDGILCRTR